MIVFYINVIVSKLFWKRKCSSFLSSFYFQPVLFVDVTAAGFMISLTCKEWREVCTLTKRKITKYKITKFLVSK